MMHFLKMDSSLLLQLVAFACGIGWVITGSVIGKWLRVGWHFALGWLPKHYLNALVFCPPCCTWWCGFALALLAPLPFLNALQVAFTASVLMAICNAQWQMDAGDREEIEQLLWSEHDERPDEQEEKHDGR